MILTRRKLILSTLAAPAIIRQALAWPRHGSATGGMVVNLQLQASALSQPLAWRNALQTAANLIQAAFLQTPGTYNIQVNAIASSAASNTTIAGMPSPYTYTQLKGFAASNIRSTPMNTFVSNLPAATSYNGQTTNFGLAVATARAFGVITPNDATVDATINIGDSVVAGALVGVVLHELTHGLGRTYDGSPFPIFPNDFMKFKSAGVPDWTNNTAGSYMSLDQGVTKFADSDYLHDPSDYLNGGVQDTPISPNPDANDALYNTGAPFNLQTLSAIDILHMNALGFQ